MSPKPYSLAVDEVKEEDLLKDVEKDFQPQLKVLINKRWNNSDSTTEVTPVCIEGRITISF